MIEMKCALCGKEIESFAFEKFLYMDKHGTIIVDKDSPNLYHPRVKLIFYDGKIERLPVHRECRMHMKRSEYVRKEYGYEDVAQ